MLDSFGMRLILLLFGAVLYAQEDPLAKGLNIPTVSAPPVIVLTPVDQKISATLLVTKDVAPTTNVTPVLGANLVSAPIERVLACCPGGGSGQGCRGWAGVLTAAPTLTGTYPSLERGDRPVVTGRHQIPLGENHYDELVHGRRTTARWRLYAYRLTAKGVRIALLFVLLRKRLCGSLANTCFHHQPDATTAPKADSQRRTNKADKAIQQMVDLLAAV